MAALAEIYIKKETLQTIIKALDAKGEQGFKMTISINDETNQHGQNVTGYAAQTKEQIAEKKPKFYVCNGKVFWTDGKITKGVKPETSEIKTPAQQKFDEHSDISDANSLPF